MSLWHCPWQVARETFYPRVCPGCLEREPGVSPTGLCERCAGALPPLRPPFCVGCGAHLEGVVKLCRECLEHERPWVRGLAVFDFADAARDYVHRLKYRGDVALAPVLARAAWARWCEAGTTPRPDVITPIPLHWFKQLLRGYNQSQLLALELSRLSGVPTRLVLRRSRWTRSQTRLSRARRLANLRRAFSVNSSLNVTGQRVLLIDDVLTTGATLEAGTRVLLEAGAATVEVLVIARG